jgi:ferredoxin
VFEKMGKILIEHNKENCIGCGSCIAINPKRFRMGEDSRSELIGSKTRKDGWQELELDDSTIKAEKETAEACPVNVIHIKKKESGEKII